MVDFVTTGTIACTNGSTAVTGTGTAWSLTVAAGDFLFVAGAAYPIASVNSDTSITLAYAFAGSTASGLSYCIANVGTAFSSTVSLNQNLVTLVNQIETEAALLGVSLSAIVANIAARAAYDDEDPGFIVAVADTGSGRAAIYSMGSGGSADWSDPLYITGTTGTTGAAGTPGDEIGVVIYDPDLSATGIDEGVYPATYRAKASGTFDTFFAEITHAGAGDTIDVSVMVGGTVTDGAIGGGTIVHGPITVTYGTPVTTGSLSIEVAEGDIVSFWFENMSGEVYGIAAQIDGVS